MPLSAEEKEDLRKMIKVARKRTVNFGLCLDGKPEDSIFMLHRKKAPEILMRRAKAEGDSPKVTCGKASVSGKVMTLNCSVEAPPNTARQMRIFLREMDMPLKVIIADATGIKDSTLKGLKPAPEATEKPSGQQVIWQEKQSKIESTIRAAIASGHPKAAAIEKAWAGAQDLAKAGKFKKAATVLEGLKPAIAATLEPDTKAAAPFVKSKALWSTTKSKMQSEMQKLQASIVSTCGKDRELAPIALEAADLAKRLDVFDGELDDRLGDLIGTPQGSTMDGLKAQARATVQEYETALNTRFFAEIDTKNGFTKVAITGPAKQALNSISKVLI